MTAIWTVVAIVFLCAVLAAVTRAPRAGLTAHEERGLACPHCPARLYMPGKALDHLISIHGLTEVEALDAIHKGATK